MYWIREKEIVCPKCKIRFKYEYREYTDFDLISPTVDAKCPACSHIIKDEGKDISPAVFFAGFIIILILLVLYMIIS